MMEHICYMMETMKQPWFSIMLMPYKDFIDITKWKVDLEEEKKKKLDEAESKMNRQQRQNKSRIK